VRTPRPEASITKSADSLSFAHPPLRIRRRRPPRHPASARVTRRDSFTAAARSDIDRGVGESSIPTMAATSRRKPAPDRAAETGRSPVDHEQGPADVSGTVPASARSRSKPGNISSSARKPPTRIRECAAPGGSGPRRCVFRQRVAAPTPRPRRNDPRPRRAAHNPAGPAPTTTALLPMEEGMAHRSPQRRSARSLQVDYPRIRIYRRLLRSIGNVKPNDQRPEYERGRFPVENSSDRRPERPIGSKPGPVNSRPRRRRPVSACRDRAPETAGSNSRSWAGR